MSKQEQLMRKRSPLQNLLRRRLREKKTTLAVAGNHGFSESDIPKFGQRKINKTKEDELQKENSSNNAPGPGRSNSQGSRSSKRRKIAISEIEYVLDKKIEEDVLLFICCQLLPCVVHPSKMNQIKNTAFKDLPDLFDWATVSDVAFAILIFDNYFEKWYALEQYSLDFGGKEMLEKHKRLLKGKHGRGNGLSGTDGLKRYQEILWRVVHMLSSAQKDWNNRFWKNFWEMFRDIRPDLELLEQKQSAKVSNSCTDDVAQEKDDVQLIWEDMLNGRLSGMPMPPIADVDEHREEDPYTGVTRYGC